MSTSADVRRDLHRAVTRIREFGLDGPRPIEEIESLLEREEELDEVLREALEEVDLERSAALIHLVGLLRRADLAEEVRRAAFDVPSPPEAKREAARLLESWGRNVSAATRERLDRVEALLASPDTESLDAVLELPEEWAVPAVDRWLEEAGENDAELARRCLGRHPGLDRIVLTWLGRIGSPEAATIVRDYLETDPGAEATKEAKRTLHRLRSQGIEVEEPEPEEKGGGGFSLEVRPRTVSDALAHASSVDGEGARLVWILLPSGSGGHRLLEGVVSDVSGLERAEVVSVTRKGYRGYLERVGDDGGLLVGRLEAVRAAALLAEAAERTRRRGGEVPGDYLEWREGIGQELAVRAEGAEPDVATGTSGVEVVGGPTTVSEAPDGRAIEESVELLNEPFFSTGARRHEAAEEAARRVRETETSSLMVDDDQRKRQAEGALADAARAFDSELRATYRRRLEIVADLLERRDRDEDARRLRAAARGFTEISDLYRRHAFARALIQRGVLLAYRRLRGEEERGSEESRIVRP